MTGNRYSVFIKLKKDHNQFWGLYSKEDELISLMKVAVHYVPVFGAVGIESIEFE